MDFPYAFASNIGTSIEAKDGTNDDVAHAFEKDDVLYLIVSDGNGAVGKMRPAGFVVNEIQRFILMYSSPNMTNTGIKKMLKSAVYCANRVLLAFKRANNEIYTNDNFATLTLAAITKQRQFIYAHSGDCRIYIVRNDKIIQITKDHTVAQQLCDEGKISKEQIFSHVDRDILISALGFNDPKIDIVASGQLQKGDIVLGVSDGIHKVLNINQIMEVIKQAGNCQDTCDGLIQYANALGGPDNISIFITYIAN